MKRSVLLLSIAAAITAAGCTGSDTASSVHDECAMPTASAQELPDSNFVLMISPTPATAETEIDLTIEAVDASDDDVATGAGALFQCWDGSNWIDIAQLLKDGFGPNNEPAAINLAPGVTVTIPAVGLLITDQPFTVLVPDVPAGVYRIEDSAIVGSAQLPIYGLIEVEST